MNVVTATGLGKRHGRTWALRDCSLTLPAGRVIALVGPNGAGKTTLLHLIAGLTRPDTGTVTVLDGRPPGSVPARERVAFVAQDAPLYPGLSIQDTVRLARHLNRSWDQQHIEASIAELELPLRRKVGRLLPGQRARLALAIALARRPELVVLDEPVARLDPLARHEFSTALMTAVADDGLSVLLTSHVVAELPAIADYLVVLAAGRVSVAGDVADLLAAHRMLTGPAEQADALARRLPVIMVRGAVRQAHLLVRSVGPFPPCWQVREVGLAELVLSYLRAPDARWLPGPAAMERIA